MSSAGRGQGMKIMETRRNLVAIFGSADDIATEGSFGVHPSPPRGASPAPTRLRPGVTARTPVATLRCSLLDVPAGGSRCSAPAPEARQAGPGHQDRQRPL